MLKDHKNWPIGPIRLVPTYMCAMFRQDSFKTKGLVCIASDGHLNMGTHGNTDRRTRFVRLLYCSMFIFPANIYQVTITAFINLENTLNIIIGILF